MRVVAPGHFRRPCCYQLNTVYEPSPGAHARKSTLALAISVRGGGGPRQGFDTRIDGGASSKNGSFGRSRDTEDCKLAALANKV